MASITDAFLYLYIKRIICKYVTFDGSMAYFERLNGILWTANGILWTAKWHTLDGSIAYFERLNRVITSCDTTPYTAHVCQIMNKNSIKPNTAQTNRK